MEHTTDDEGVGSLAFLCNYNQHDDDDDEEVTILHSSTSSKEKGPATESSFKDKRSVVERNKEPSASGVKGKKVGEKRKNADIAEMMGSYIELKTKQTQVDVVEQERARDESASFSIKNCNAVLATIEELSGEERADAYEVFKDAQNREIFITAEPSSRLIWLRRKIVS